jgi:predicted RNA-binding protein YlqC (UPF0109 family)
MNEVRTVVMRDREVVWMRDGISTTMRYMPDPRDSQVYHVIFKTVCLLASHPDDVVVRTVWTNEGASFTICAHADDLETVFGRESLIEESLQHVLREMGTRLGRRFAITVDRDIDRAEDVA